MEVASAGKRTFQRLAHTSDSFVVLGAVSKGRWELVARLNSLMLAASFTGIWAYVRTDRNPADEPSREQ